MLLVQNEKFFLHKIVLASCSPVFEKMFFGLMASSDEVSILDIEAGDLKQAIDFIYTGKLELKSVTNAWSLVYIANKYLISELLDLCVDYIERNLTLSTLFLSYEHAELYNLEKLIKTCLRDALIYMKGVLVTSYHIKPATWNAILNENLTNNADLAAFALKWAVNECNFRETKSNVLKVLRENNLTQFLEFTEIDENLLSDSELGVFKAFTSNSLTRSPLVTKNRLHYQVRPWYKIYKNFRLVDNDVLTTTVSVNAKVALFGIAVSTEHRSCNAESDFYTGGFVVEICKDDGFTLEKFTEPSATLTYDETHQINFKRIVVLEASTNYIIGVRYRNADQQTRLEVLCHYLGNINRNSVVFTFSNEIYGSALRGLAFYPF